MLPEDPGAGCSQRNRGLGAPRRSGGWGPGAPGRLVRLGELNTNNWSSLLALRERLLAGGDRDTGHPGEEAQDAVPHALGSSAATTNDDDTHPADEPGPSVVTRIRHPQYRQATKQQRQQVLDLYRAGLAIHEITQQAGVNRSSVNRMCRDAGLSRKPRGNEAQRHRARALRAQGLTLAQVAWEVGFSRSTIQRWLADSYDIPSNHEQDDTQ